MLDKLLKLANKLDEIEQYRVANEIDVLFKVAAKVDVLKEKYPNHMFEIDKLNEADPTPTKKYLEWAAKQISTSLYTTNEVAGAIKQFHLHHQKLENKDINSYKTLEDLEKALVGKDLPSKRQLKQVSKSGADVIYESPNYVVIHPKTKESVCTYGAGTKWCITMKDQDHYENYSSRGIVFYYILDRHPKDEIMNKVAIAFNVMNGTGLYEIFDAQDRQIDIRTLADYYGNEWSAIESAIKTHSRAEGMQTAEEYMMQLALNGTLDQKAEIAEQANVPASILAILAKEDDEYIQKALASNANTPIDVLLELANTNDINVAKNVARNPSANAEVIQKLVTNKIYSGSDDDMYGLRERIAANANTPSEILDSFVRLRQFFLDKYIAYNPNVSIDSAKILLDRHGESFGILMAHNSKAPAILSLLFDYALESETGAEIRKLVARNPNSPLEIVVRAAQDSLQEVRDAAYNTNRIPADIFATLIQKENTSKKAEIAFGDNPIYIEILSRDPNDRVRSVAAMNLEAPRDVLERLMRDENKQVATYAQETLERIANKKALLRTSRLQKLSQQLLQNNYYPLGQKGDEYGDNAEQESTVPEEINEEMEAQDMEGNTPGTDNLIIDKDNNPTDGFGALANFGNNAILLKCRISKRIGIQ